MASTPNQQTDFDASKPNRTPLRVVVFAGPPGAGKTTLSRCLGAHLTNRGLAITRHSIDDYKREYLKHAENGNKPLGRKEQWQAYRRAIEKTFASRRANVVIIDTPYCQEKQRNYLRQSLGGAQMQCKALLWVVPREMGLSPSNRRKQWASFACAQAVARRDPSQHQVDGAAVGAALWHGMNFAPLVAQHGCEAVVEHDLLRADAVKALAKKTPAHMARLIETVERDDRYPPLKILEDFATACSTSSRERYPKDFQRRRTPLHETMRLVLAHPFFSEL